MAKKRGEVEVEYGILHNDKIIIDENLQIVPKVWGLRQNNLLSY